MLTFQVEAECLRAIGGGGVQLQSHHKAEEHPLGYQPTPQPQAPPAPSPTGAPVILSIRPETQWKWNEVT